MFRTFLVAALIALVPLAPASAQRNKPAVPDLTAGGQADDKHDWNLGPTGARGWMWGWKRETTDARQILVTEVTPGSPAAGVLLRGDVILGVGDVPFKGDPRRVLGDAITAAEGRKGKGRLTLLVWRGGDRQMVEIILPILSE